MSKQPSKGSWWVCRHMCPNVRALLALFLLLILSVGGALLVLRLDSQSASFYISRGQARSDKTDYDKAIADFAEAIRLDPKCVYALNSRGHAWSETKDFDKAIADFTEAIRLDPKNVYAFKSRGYAWAEKREYDKAIADYSEAIHLVPGKFRCLLQPRMCLAGNDGI